jgi:predicted acylesterase/phospholipase RssA
MRDLASVEWVAHEGGGILGMAQVPALRALERAKPLTDLKGSAGASAGAILALLVNLGHTTDELLALMESTPWGKWTPGKWRVVTRGIRFLKTWGLFPNKRPRKWLAERLSNKGFHSCTTFGELYAATGRELYVTATNMDRGTPVLFSSKGTPSVGVVDAVLASMSVQIVFPPVVINGERHNDGGLTWNHPVDIFRDKNPEQVLGIRVDRTSEVAGREEPLAGPFQLIGRTVGIAVRHANRSHVAGDLWPRIIRVVCDEKALDFNLTPLRVGRLLAAGELATKLWLRQ